MKIRPPLIAATMLLAPLSVLAQSHPWQANLRLAEVRTHDGSSTLPTTSYGLDLQPGGAAELALNYTFLPEWALELSLTHSRLDIDAVTEGVPAFNAGSARLGIAALVLQYRVFVVGRLRPYLGVGVNFASLSGFSADEALTSSGLDTISFSRSVSISAQVGADYAIDERFSINADIAFHDVGTTAAVMLPSGERFGTLQVDVDPWVLALGVGYRF
jgi:outer membrane protein